MPFPLWRLSVLFTPVSIRAPGIQRSTTNIGEWELKQSKWFRTQRALLWVLIFSYTSEKSCISYTFSFFVKAFSWSLLPSSPYSHLALPHRHMLFPGWLCLWMPFFLAQLVLGYMYEPLKVQLLPYPSTFH